MIKEVMKRVKDIKSNSMYIKFDCENCTRDDEMRCCKSCRSGNGYLHDFIIDDIQYNLHEEYYKKLFDEKTGYWRKNKGCILPRSMKSLTCLSYYCGVGVPKVIENGHYMKLEELKSLKLIHYKIKSISDI